MTVSQFAFPLNVYAHLLELEGKPPRYMHYGIFETPDENIDQAQEHSTQLLLEHLPPAPCRILEVGIGLGTLLEQLLALGYDVEGITPDPAQVDYVRRRLGDDTRVHQLRLDEFTDEKPFDVLLFQESCQYIDPMDLFSAGRRLLAPQGQILILDEFARFRSEATVENLHLREHFLRQGARFGFKLLEHIDLASRAAPTVDHILRLVEKHRPALTAHLGLTAEQLDTLSAANQSYRTHYAEGRYGYDLLRFSMEAPPRWLPGPVHDGNQAEMLALFEQVFGHAMAPEHRAWKYGGNRGVGVGVWQEGELVAHYGGVSRRLLFRGKPASLVQLCDVMVKSMGRASLSRKGPFFLTAATFLERFLGYGTRHLLAIGFPNARARGLPEKLGLYAGTTAKMMELAWAPLPCRRKLLTKTRALTTKTQGAANVADSVWQRMAADLFDQLVVVRDWSYLSYRYLEHPTKHYELFAVHSRISGKCHGIIVLGRDGERAELLDVIAPLAAIPELVRHARRIAGCWGSKELYCWITDHFVDHFSPQDGKAIDLGIPIPHNTWTAGPPEEEISGRWWLTSGDVDFH